MSAHTSGPARSDAARRLAERAAPWLLLLATIAVYAPSLGGGWLDYDDDWLVRDNPFLRRPNLASWVAIWTDLTRSTRLILGAEFLPVRDTSHWLEALAFGVEPPLARVVSLASYGAACLLVRSWLRRLLPATPALAELAAWLFALHPVHAESVAWLAGRKDVLSLLFVAAALRAHHARSPGLRRALVPLFAGLACLSKATSVVLPALLLLDDWVSRRRPDPVQLGGVSAVTAAALALHLHVGSVVSMLAPLPGGSRLAALVTMGPVFLRYIGLSLGALPGSLAYEVPERTPLDPAGLAAWACLALLGAACVRFARRGERLPMFALAWSGVSLLPVSQALAPLQNRMADRYLLLAVLGPLLASAWGLERLRALARPGLALGLAGALALAAGLLTLDRAATFADPERLWVQTAERAPLHPLGPYQLAMHRQGRGDLEGAEEAFLETLRRDRFRHDISRSAMNNLAILRARTGRGEQAILLLEEATRRFPDDPRVRNNLAMLLESAGQVERAAALRAELAERFPDYRPGRSWRDGEGPAGPR